MGRSQVEFAADLGKSYGMVQHYERLRPPSERGVLAQLILLAARHEPSLLGVFAAAFEGAIRPIEKEAEAVLLRGAGIDPQQVERYKRFLQVGHPTDVRAVRQIIDEALLGEEG